MVKFVEPQIFMIGATAIDPFQVKNMMEAVGAEDWHYKECIAAQSDGEALTEIAGRMCYKSFGTDLNDNITKVREDSTDYINNILKSKHGSVLEHGTVTFGLVGISRIITHEIVRHRAGVAYSQESMRYVRTGNFRFYYPDPFEGTEITKERLKRSLSDVEESYMDMSQRLFTENLSFHEKKQMTSALRRMLPAGVCTDLIMTANHRAWRHMIEMRTSAGAEEEIRKLFRVIATQLADAHQNIYQDMFQADDGSITFTNSKI